MPTSMSLFACPFVVIRDLLAWLNKKVLVLLCESTPVVAQADISMDRCGAEQGVMFSHVEVSVAREAFQSDYMLVLYQCTDQSMQCGVPLAAHTCP